MPEREVVSGPTAVRQPQGLEYPATGFDAAIKGSGGFGLCDPIGALRERARAAPPGPFTIISASEETAQQLGRRLPQAGVPGAGGDLA